MSMGLGRATHRRSNMKLAAGALGFCLAAILVLAGSSVDIAEAKLKTHTIASLSSSAGKYPTGERKVHEAVAAASAASSVSIRKPKLWPRNLVKYTKARAVLQVHEDFASFVGLGLGEAFTRVENALYKTWCTGNRNRASCLVRGGFDALPSGSADSFCDQPTHPTVSDDVPGCWFRELWQRTITVTRVNRRKVWIKTSTPGLKIFRIYNSPSRTVPPALREFYYDSNGPGSPPLPLR